MCYLDRLKPNGLPNARSARVEAAVRVQLCGLLARKLLARKNVILGINGDVISLFAKRVGDIISKRRVSALVRRTYRLAVDKYARGVIAGVDVQNHTLASPLCGNINISAIPNRIHKIGVSYSRKNRFGRERHVDFLRETVSLVKILFETNLGVINFKIPYAVQIQPILAQSVGAGMLASWNVAHVFSPIIYLLFFICCFSLLLCTHETVLYVTAPTHIPKSKF